jgi:hypothetical protein
MESPSFSAYHQRENRITNYILTMFKGLSFPLMEQILQTLIDEPNIPLLTIEPQPNLEGARPDGIIRASFCYLIETKIIHNAITEKQIQRHLIALENDQNVNLKRLLILTPDYEEPVILKQIKDKDKRIIWTNFEALANSIRKALFFQDEWPPSGRPIPNEREREYLNGFVQYLVKENLIGNTEEQVIVVAARIALEEYQRMNVYMCQPNRTFQQSSYIAFYNNNRIYKYIPCIDKRIDNIIFSEEAIYANADLEEKYRERLIDILGKMEYYRKERINNENKIFLLTAPEDERTLKLDYDIENDIRAESGRKVAFVQGQRYIPKSKFLLKPSPRTTTELLK